MGQPSSDSISISEGSIRRAGVLAGAVVLAVVLLAAGYLAGRSVGTTDSLASAINHSEYQSIVLTNGQIYFGKLSAPGGDFYYLTHVYYLTQQASRSGRPLSRVLVPLVSDVHGPEDMMVVNRSQIVYMENLRPNGKAAQLLRQGGQ
jgi:hypothetical protein